MNNEFDEVWKREEVESPCIKLCVIHEPSGLCMGCYRSRHEIAGWSQKTPDQRSALMSDLSKRAPQVVGKRRKR